jgi:hypothetical protein
MTLTNRANRREPWGVRGAMADEPQDHPMPQSALDFVVGQRLGRVGKNGKHRIPVVQELDREGMRLGMGMSLHRLASAAARPKHLCLDQVYDYPAG